MYHQKSIYRFVCLLLFCTACSTTTPFVDQPTPTQDISGLTVILGYSGQAEYISAARANPEGDLEALYQEYVLDPYWLQCVEGGEYIELDERGFSNPIRDLEQLEQMTQSLTASDVETQVKEAYAQAKLHLPSENTTICVFAADPENLFIRYQMNGVTGLTAGAGKIWLEIDPEGNWEKWIDYVVAHEYHHSVWTTRYYDEKAPFFLIDALVFEGRADTFAHQLYPKLTAPWTNALSKKDENAQWETIQGILKVTSPESIQGYMFGNQRRIPQWTGYTIGFHIVQALIEKNPELSVEELAAMGAMDVLEQSGYGTKE